MHLWPIETQPGWDCVCNLLPLQWAQHIPCKSSLHSVLLCGFNLINAHLFLIYAFPWVWFHLDMTRRRGGSALSSFRNIPVRSAPLPPDTWHYHRGWGGSSEGSRPDQPTGKLAGSEVMDKPPWWVTGQTNQINNHRWSPFKPPPMKRWIRNAHPCRIWSLQILLKRRYKTWLTAEKSHWSLCSYGPPVQHPKALLFMSVCP